MIVCVMIMACTLVTCFQALGNRRRLVMSSSATKRVAVIGGGFGGLYTALKIAKMSEAEEADGALKTEVTLIDPKDKFVFLPLLYELTVGTATVQEVAPKYCDLLDKTSIKFVQGSVESVDIEQRELLTKSTTEDKVAKVAYDKLVIACGAQPNVDAVPGLREFSIPFTRVEDSYRVKASLRSLAESDLDTVKVVVLGAGYSGVEVATTVSNYFKERNRDATITILDRNDRVMKTSPLFNQQTAMKTLNERDVKVLFKTSISQVTKNGLNVRGVDTDSGLETGDRFVEADLVIATLGIQQSPLLGKIEPPLAKDPLSDRLLTKNTLQSLSRDDVYVLGDCAKIDGVPLPSTAQVAMQQSDIVSKNIMRVSQDAKDLEKFNYIPLGEMLTLGTSEAAIYGLGGLVELEGPLASAARRLVYAVRMPTRQQTATALLNQLVSTAATVASKALKNTEKQC